METPEEEYICSMCKEEFLSRASLEEHYKLHLLPCNCEWNATQDMKQNDKKKKSCKICLGLATKGSNVISKQDYFMCSECGKQFKSRGELTHHINSKCGTIKLFTCKVCGQQLMTAGSLHNHMLRHKGEKNFMCKFCAKLFLTAGQLKVHERKHTNEKAFICKVCNKGFCHRQSLITHSSIHTGVKPYQCENCGKSFSCVGNLIKHRKSHAKTCGSIPLNNHTVKNPNTRIKVKINTPETCKLRTNGQNKNKSSSEFQQTNINEDVSFKIEDTKPDSSKKPDCCCAPNSPCIEFMRGSYPLERSNSCFLEPIDQCQRKESYNNLRSFIKKIGDQNDQNGSENSKRGMGIDVNIIKDGLFSFDDEKDKPKSIFARRQSETFANDPNLMDENFDDISIPSDNEEGTSEFNTNSEEPEEVEENICGNRKRRRPTKAGTPKKQVKIDDLSKNINYKCTHCERVFKSRSNLLKHESAHDKLKQNYSCIICKTCFDTKELCKEHERNEHADILTCQNCDKVFANKDSLKAHQHNSHDGRPRKNYTYICDRCGKSFRQKAQMVVHKERDCADEPLFACSVCDKVFSSVYTQKAHMKVHSAEKELLCKFCGKKFRWKGQLTIHERSHTGEKPFKCMFCPKAFAYRDSLITHSSTHTGIKPHFCKGCGWRFSCIGNLIKHKNTHIKTCGTFYDN